MRSAAFTTDLDQIDPADIAAYGGKAANLARLRRAGGIDVPDGFCVTTAAFDDTFDAAVRARQADRHLDPARFRDAVATADMPKKVASAIAASLSRFPYETPFAVRSSATAEDLGEASFAGQHNSYLNVVGAEAVIDAVRRCWASLFTERAVTYRGRAGAGADSVSMAVVVQQMVAADASGVMFTASPVTGDRRTTVIEAVHGLGDALVSGRTRPDASYHVRDEQLVRCDLVDAQDAVLTATQATRLARLGRRVESAMGQPQDIEWCLRNDSFFVVQSRPITTLFPHPPHDDDTYHVYLSVGHQQMMTDAMTPLGLSCWQMSTPAPMAEAGNRLWVDVTARLASPSTREPLLQMAREHDPLTFDALTAVLDSGRLPASAQRDARQDNAVRVPPGAGEDDPTAGLPPEPDEALVLDLIARAERSIANAAHRLTGVSGADVFAALREDWQELRRTLFDPDGLRVLQAAMASATWLNDHLADWLGEPNAADILTRGAEHDPTANMGLALLDVADTVRHHPDVIRYLSAAQDDSTLLTGLDEVHGGPAVRQALESWLQSYGARCPGEIDIARPRWAERPTTLVPLLLAHVRDAEAGEATRRVARGRSEADAWQRHLIDRLREQPDAAARIDTVQRHIAVVRAYTGYREYPKYAKIRRYWVYKQVLLRELDRLVDAGVLRTREDGFYLRFDELEQTARSGHADLALVYRRCAQYDAARTLVPPRVLTSDGEMLNGSYSYSDAPAGALVGLPASTGTVTGRARVVLDPDNAHLEPGDILVTRFTDPSWTPLFVTAAALVTEIGGFMTHGAVVAREYGLPAVLGVDRATTLIRDGQQIRVDGARGWIETM